ncbi:hypothetical protein [Alloactinosynnema sp. L-07]|uniref:hypothetical protein n=1 Tax=Alloactinosynnema sp. L-07 TaxID=1653480 RepID=UPI00065F0184|nr:hypothetical protein [Alloactinosynnema sp. L-07]CRK56234.1 hypothetical protein [Alloactinosynnema sp. L-07]
MTAATEIAKLARLLGDQPERFAYLADLPVSDLRVLREKATDVLFDANRAVFERIAAASKLVPTGVTAAVAQKAFGPLLCARVAGVLEPERAIDIAGRLPVDFLADVAAELDPRRAAGVLAALPAGPVVAVGTELARRGDYVTMGRFIGELPASALKATVEALDTEAILRTAAFSEVEDRFAEIFAMIPDAKVAEVARVFAEASDELGEAVLPVLRNLDKAGLTRLAAEVRQHSPEQRAHFAAIAERVGVLDRLGPLAEALNG